MLACITSQRNFHIENTCYIVMNTCIKIAANEQCFYIHHIIAIFTLYLIFFTNTIDLNMSREDSNKLLTVSLLFEMPVFFACLSKLAHVANYGSSAGLSSVSMLDEECIK